LDVATGTGDLVLGMDRILQLETIVGVDLSEEMLALARRKTQSDASIGARLEFRQADTAAPVPRCHKPCSPDPRNHRAQPRLRRHPGQRAERRRRRARGARGHCRSGARGTRRRKPAVASSGGHLSVHTRGSTACPFCGKRTITAASDHYGHANGTGELFGVFYRRIYALTVQAIGTLRG
jgi:predicted RNA-binding Zn-ribbon protein involved in translation (DUF1610 family)